MKLLDRGNAEATGTRHATGGGKAETEDFELERAQPHAESGHEVVALESLIKKYKQLGR